ncbi:MAG TPA: hypothetical protein VL460_03435 [Caulobacteraceae bacterium]|nr:hypothetical protein [Caulobacteraceae bacterium]
MSLAIGAYTPNINAMAGASANATRSSPAADSFLQALNGASSTDGASLPPTTTDASAAARDSGAGTAVSDFLNYANETPAQRMRDAILKSMGLSEDDLKAMSPEQRQAVENTIRERIKDAAEEAAKKGKTGLVADVTA